MIELITNPHTWIALLTLTALEIVLGIDNIVFITIFVGRLPQHQRKRARLVGLSLAMLTRIALLLALNVIMQLTTPLFKILSHGFSGRDLILIVGGLFLLAKSTLEIHTAIEGKHENTHTPSTKAFGAVIVQIAVIDIIFSLDSVITAVGMAEDVEVMILAIIIAIIAMMAASGAISDFVETHPTIKMLALSFLVLIGVTLIGDGLSFHIPKGYIYFAMAFSLLVELLNLKMRHTSNS
jgi:predicted tellurium resistance membrane protein TerC